MAITLESGDSLAVVRPDLGAGLERFDFRKQPIFRPAPPGTTDPFALANIVLVPWSNRISGHGFAFGGRFHRLEPNWPGEPCPMHGNGFQRAWNVLQANATFVEMELVSEGPGPFQYKAIMRYELNDDVLVMNLEVVNQADMALPFGLGFHPWLPRDASTTLEARALRIVLEDERHLPAGTTAIGEREDWDFRRPRLLPSGWINNAFLDWDGKAKICWPNRRVEVEIHCEENSMRFIVFSPGQHADFFCFEPVTHSVDAHNQPGGPVANGLQILKPEQSMRLAAAFALSGMP